MLKVFAQVVSGLPMVDYLLALDQSTATTGYAIFQDGKLLTVGHVSPTGGSHIVRIVKLRKWLKNIISTLDGNIEVAIEDIQLQQFEPNGGRKQSRDMGVTTYKKLAHVQGVLMCLLEDKGIKYYVVSPASWKSACGIGGKYRDDQKARAQEFAKVTYGLTPTQDEADAVCIGHYILKNSSVDHDWS